VYQSQCEIQALAVPRVSIVGYSHGRLLHRAIRVIPLKK
jgi:hypothetical protein